MQAVDEAVSKQITVTPNELPEGANVDFQPTSKQGVSFPNNDTTPTITVHFGKPAHVRSVTIPRDTTHNANVQQFEVTFYSPEGKKVNNQPILSNSSPQDDKYLPAGLDSSQIPSNTPVSRLDITVLKTTDSQSPKGVVLDIQACTKAGAGKCSDWGPPRQKKFDRRRVKTSQIRRHCKFGKPRIPTRYERLKSFERIVRIYKF